MNWVLTVFLLLGCFWAEAKPRLPHGYIQDTKAEKEERFYEIFLFAEPPPQGKNLRDVIFNAELSAEFKERYRNQFGQIDTESINYQHTNSFERFDSNRGVNPQLEQETRVRRDFAGYMIKRLFEWHLDNYIKSEPAMRPVYEIKEKLKKVEVRVTKQTKLEMRYSLAGNILELTLENPYADTRLEIDMDPKSIGPTSIEEQKLISTLPLTTRLRAENTVFDKGGRDRLEFIKTHTSNFSTSYGVNSAYKDTGSDNDTRISMGLGYSF